MNFIDPSTDLKPSYASFYKAWEKARILPEIPNRQDISLREFASFADSMQIYELRARGQLHCRLIGSEIVNRAQSLDPEHNIFDFFDLKMRPVAEHWWHTMADEPCGGYTRFSVEYPSGAKRIVESIVLPVRGKSGKPLFIIYSDAPEYQTSVPARNRLILAEDGYEAHFINIG